MPVNKVTAIYRKFIRSWEQFWFKFDAYLPLSFIRIFLGVILLWHSIDRSQFLDIYYKDTGLVKRADSLLLMLDFFRPHFSFFIWPESLISTVNYFLIFLIILMILGIGGRLVLFAIWFINLSFMQRNYALLFGADLISNIFLFYLMFTNSGRYFSVVHLFNKPKKAVISELDSIVTSAFARLIQIQLCIVYFYTGMEKLRGSSWWDGTALWTVLANPQMVLFDFSWLKSFSWVIVIGTYMTILFEVYFTPLVWNKKSRSFVIAAGVIFHSGIGIVMALYTFALVMIAPYFLFIDLVKLEKVHSFIMARGTVLRKNLKMRHILK